MDSVKHIVAYAKISTDKDKITLQGVYFGGIGDTQDEANAIARDCVNTIRGGTILPKVLPLQEQGQLMEAMFDACDKFEQITMYMIESQETIMRTSKKKKK